jgi:hypothetical protein
MDEREMRQPDAASTRAQSQREQKRSRITLPMQW